MVIIGPNVMAKAGEKHDALRHALQGIPVVELDSSFSTLDAGEAAQQVLEKVKAHTASG